MNVTPELDSLFRAAAIREGIVDVRYDVIDSPIGDLFLAATDRGLCRISYTIDGQDEELARIFGVRILRSPLDRCGGSWTSTSKAAGASSIYRSTCGWRRSTRPCCASLHSCPTDASTPTGRWPRRSGVRGPRAQWAP